MAVKNTYKHEYAELLYMKGLSQKMICEKVSITPATILKWKKDGQWEAKRAARAVSVDELISKALIKINDILDGDNFSADQFAKAVAPLKQLQSRVTPDDKVTTLMDFGDWVISQIGIEQNLTGELAQQITTLQDAYILKVIRYAHR